MIEVVRPADEAEPRPLWDDARTDEYTIFRDGAPFEIVVRCLQQTATDEEERETGSRTEARGADFGHECRTVTTKQRFRRSALSYRYRVYKAQRTLSRRFALGVTAFSVGLAGVAFLIGADLQLIVNGASQYFVTEGDSLTPLGAVALIVAGLLAGIGLSLFVGAPPDYVRGEFKEDRQDLVTKDWYPHGQATVEEGEWGPCLS